MYLKQFFAVAAAALWCAASHADWAMAPGASARLGGGTVSLGCANLYSGGNLQLDGGAVLGARDVHLTSTAQVDIGTGRIELAQQWNNQGSAQASSGGGAIRVASPGCPIAGAPGPVALQPITPPTPVQVLLPPSPGGGPAPAAQVAIGIPGAGGTATSLPPGCVVTQLSISRTLPASVPANASAPLGVLQFAADGCPGSTLQVSVTYPAGSLAGLIMQKYGPYGTPRRAGWFTPPGVTVAGDTVSYTVTDGGEGDSDARPGYIVDPFAPILLAAAPGGGSGSAHAIPTLGEWSALALSALLALLGARSLRRRAVRRTTTTTP